MEILFTTISILLSVFNTFFPVHYDETSTYKGVRAAIRSLETKKNEKTGFTVINTVTGFSNSSNNDITSISYSLIFLDKSGSELERTHFTWYGNDTALSANESCTHEMGFQLKLDGILSTVSVEITGYQTVEQLPLIHLPLPDETLAEALDNDHLRNIKADPPVAIHILIDHMGDEEIADITDAETIDSLINAFTQITIENETNEFVTDNYNHIRFDFADGETVDISLNLYSLEVPSHGLPRLYSLNDNSGFFALCNELAEYPE